MRYRRAVADGGLFFFTVVTASRRPILIAHFDRLRRAFRSTQARHPFRVEALVVLPDHLHTIWRLPEGDCDYSFRWMVLKRTFSTGLEAGTRTRSERAKREKAIWQRRFWEHRIRDDLDLVRHLDYIHYNPVKHGYCERPAAWPYSTFGRMVMRGIYPADWGGPPHASGPESE
jgi:putative transposase